MTTKVKKKFRSTIAEAAHETASGLHRLTFDVKDDAANLRACLYDD